LNKWEELPADLWPGETIPIRLFLGGFDLTPTFRDVNKKYSTRYYLSLVLIDEDARRYFKQSEITLYRQAPEIAATPQIAQQQQIQQQQLLQQQKQQQPLPEGSATAGPGRESYHTQRVSAPAA
jgi:vacuolar protein sorting-associated protein 26